ncbi:MAG: hypothetical protein WCL16_04190 [bacterium]
MSRSYEFKVMVRGYETEWLSDICAALATQWGFDPSEFPLQDETPPAELNVSGVGCLTAGMTADDMAARLEQTVWVANTAYCEVEVWSTFMNVIPPADVHSWNGGDYRNWLEQGGADSDERNHKKLAPRTWFMACGNMQSVGVALH